MARIESKICLGCGKQFNITWGSDNFVGIPKPVPKLKEGWEHSCCSRDCQTASIQKIVKQMDESESIQPIRPFPAAEMTEIVMPSDANPHGTAFGGKIMQWIDMVAAIAAWRFTGKVVTASIDSLVFRKPIQIGDIVTLKAAVNRAWNSSMEVGVKVWCESRETQEMFVACKAYLTFVAVDDDGKRCPVAKPFVPEYGMWARRYKEADERRCRRLEKRKK